MPLIRSISKSAEATRVFGERLGALAEPGDLVCLIGELGAGKTLFTQGVAAGLGMTAAAVAAVVSPTYSLIAEHTSGRVALYHMDAFRLAGSSELGPLGFDEYIARADGLIVIEWSDRIADALPGERLEIEIVASGEPGRRAITASAYGDRAKFLARAVFAGGERG